MTSSHMQSVAEEAILDYFRNPEHEPFHSDDLEHVIPDEHRGVISLAVMALVNKKLIVGCGYRKSAIPSRKRSPSQEYRLTELGRNRLVGVGGEREGGKPGRASRAISGSSPHSGENAGVGAGVLSPQGAEGEALLSPCTSTDPGEQEDPSAGSTQPCRQLPAGGSARPAEAVPLFEEPAPPSAYDPFSEAA